MAAVLIGESGPDLAVRFRSAGLARTERARTIEEAVRIADGIAREAVAASARRGALRDAQGITRESGPATVLLSPAAASFDMFVDYAARGRAFKEAVAAIAAAREEGRPR